MIFSTKLKLLCLLVIVFIGLAAVAVYIAVFQGHTQHNQQFEQLKVKNKNAVVSNGHECANIGLNILQNHNGTAVDAAIATLFCEGVAVPQSMGLGGGFFATIYNKADNNVETLIARERAPLAAHANMYANMSEVTGILSVGVPGELKGYWEMHQKYGRIDWKTLIEPSIELCKKGHRVSVYLAFVLHAYERVIKNSIQLTKTFINPKTNEVWNAGDYIKRPKLAETLTIIANDGVDAMYSANGTLAHLLADEIKELGGIITIDDFVKYTVEWKKPVVMKLSNNQKMYSPPLPASGHVLSLIMNVLNGFPPNENVQYFHRLMETYKFAYGKRSALGDVEMDTKFMNDFLDNDFAKKIRDSIWDNQTFNDVSHYGGVFAIPEDHGTAHMSVLAENGDAVSVTSSINTILGSKIISSTTGIIFNDEMDDFSSPDKTNIFGFPPSPANFIEPGKRPLSSMTPVIILNENNDVVMLIGAAGGSRITTSVALTIVRHLWLDYGLQEAVDAKRIHHQLMPMNIIYEGGFNKTLLEELTKFGHRLQGESSAPGFSCVTAISKSRGFVEAAADARRNGSAAIQH